MSNLYGTADYGGLEGDGYGAVFELKLSGQDAPTYSNSPILLDSFNASSNANGSFPLGSVTFDKAGNLLGTTYYSGDGGYGTVFEIPATTTGFGAAVTLGSFDGANGHGSYPTGSLTADSAGNLYGTTFWGGDGGLYGPGTVFEVPKSITGYGAPITLYSFNGTDGANPAGSLILDSANEIFGTTKLGGSNGDGTVFEINRTATGLINTTTLVSFDGGNGANPLGDVVADANGNLFGTTSVGGDYGDGTVFEIPKMDGHYSPAITIVSFTGTNGANPVGSLIIDAAGDLYGTTKGGGDSGDGTVFKISNSGTVSHPMFAGTVDTLVSFNGADGGNPLGSLFADDAGNLFGTTNDGGTSAYGTIFELVAQDPAVETSAGATGAIACVPTIIDPEVKVSDAYSATLSSATVSITEGFQGVEDTLGFNNQNGITGQFNATTGVLALTGTATLAQYQAALQSVTYADTSSLPHTAHRTVQFVVDDGSAESLAANRTVTVAIAHSNAAAAPSITGLMSSQTASDTTALRPFATAGVTDPNAGSTDTLTITVTGPGALLGTDLVKGVAGTYTLSGTASVLTADLQALSFTPAGGQANTSSTTILALSDASTAGTSATGSIAITDVNAAIAPSITGLVSSQTASDTTALHPFVGANITDSNAGSTDTLTITVTGPGTLSGTHLVTGTGATYSLTGTASALSADLQAICFTPAGGQANTSSTTTLSLSDATSAGTSATGSIAITDVNAATAPSSDPAAVSSSTPTQPPIDNTPVNRTLNNPTVVFAGRGVFTISSQVTTSSDVESVAFSADIDGQRTDLGSATVNPDGSYSFNDNVGRASQTDLVATEIDGAGGTVSTSAPLSLTAGVQGQPYTAEQDSYDPITGAYIGSNYYGEDGSLVYANTYTANPGGTQTYSYAGGSYFDDKPYSSFADTYDAVGILLTQVRDRNDGATVSIIDMPGQTLSSDGLGDDIFRAGHQGSNTFVFATGFAQALIMGFTATGPNHDTVSLPVSDFGNRADVLRNTQTSGNGVTITDPTSGDVLTIAGVTKTELIQHKGDFTLT